MPAHRGIERGRWKSAAPRFASAVIGDLAAGCSRLPPLPRPSPPSPAMRPIRSCEACASAARLRPRRSVPRPFTTSRAARLRRSSSALIDEVIRNKPDAIVLAPYDAKAMVAAVDRLNAAGIAVTNVNERLAGGKVVSYVGTDDYELALATARTLVKAMGGKGNVVILEGPENLRAQRGPGERLQGRAQGISRGEARGREIGELRPRSGGRRDEGASCGRTSQIDGVLAANDAMAIGAIEQLKAANKKGAGGRDQCRQGGARPHQVGRPPRQRRLQRLSRRAAWASRSRCAICAGRRCRKR